MIIVVLLAWISVALAQIDPTCLDALPDCEKYEQDSCVKFPTWAKDKCKNFCGICHGPTKAPPPCTNTVQNCDQYGRAACSNPTYKGWAETKCRYFCRLCTPSQLAMVDAIKTTMSPFACRDKVNCREYTKASCSGQYTHWAKENCPVFCGLCAGANTPAPVCADALPNCATYGKSVCGDSHYKLWVEDNCFRYCGCGSITATPAAFGPTPGPVVTPKPAFPVPSFG